MPFARPTLSGLIDRFRADLDAFTTGGPALLRRSVERMLSRAVPGQTHGLHGHLAWIARQILPTTCEVPGVLAWAAMLGLELKPATKAVCDSATFATTGPTIPLGTLVRTAVGVRYVVTSSSVASGVVTVALAAEEPGAAGNAASPPSILLSLVSPIAGVDSAGVVTDPDGIHDGTDVEDVDASLRARVLERLANPPRGGAEGDYAAWALEVAGVTRAWETPRVNGAGTVGLQFVVDDDPSGPIPAPAKITEVVDHIAPLAPVTVGRSIDGDWVGVIVTAPTADPINPVITALDPDTAEVRAAIEAELVDFLRREAEPGLAVALSRFDEAISAADGERSHTLASPSANIAPAAGHLPVLGTITWPS